MKWSSCPASVRTVVAQFLKAKDWEPATAPIVIDSWATSVVRHPEKATPRLFVRIAVTHTNSTTYQVTGVIRPHGKSSWRLVPNTLTVEEEPPQDAPVKDSNEQETSIDAFEFYE